LGIVQKFGLNLRKVMALGYKITSDKIGSNDLFNAVLFTTGDFECLGVEAFSNLGDRLGDI
jgi:hypothetical protein